MDIKRSAIRFVYIGSLLVFLSYVSICFAAPEPDLPTGEGEASNSLLGDKPTDSTGNDDILPLLPVDENNGDITNSTGDDDLLPLLPVDENTGDAIVQPADDTDPFGTGSGGNQSGNPGTGPTGGSNTGGSNTGSNGNSSGTSGGSNSGSGPSSGSSGNGSLGGLGTDLINDFSKNKQWARGILNRQDNYRRLEVKLANDGLRELQKPELIHREDYTSSLDGIPKKLLEEELSKMDQQMYGDSEGKNSRLNTYANISAFPRSTYEIINLKMTETFKGTCHITFRDVFSSDKGEQYKYFASPLVSLTSTLMDLPRVKLEQFRNEFMNNTGVLRCFKHDKQFVSVANMIQPVKSSLNSRAEISYMEKNELFPSLGAEKSPICMDFVGERFPWSGYTTKFFSSYRHLAALQQGLDSQEYFQYLSSRNGGGSNGSAALPIGHTIIDKDRFYGLKGNFALEVAESGDNCPTVKEMTKQSLEYKKGNSVDMKTSEYQGFERYMTMLCGGGDKFRGRVLKSDNSQTMCQTDSNAKPDSGRVRKYWDFEVRYKEGIVPKGQTRVC